MDTKSLIEKAESILSPEIGALGYDLIEVEFINERGWWILRLYIDSEGAPVTLADCERVSHAAGAVLDVEDIIPYRYNLEVSSPGAERPLRREKDFRRYGGCEVRIKTRNKLSGRRNFRGIIKGVNENNVQLAEGDCIIEIPISEIYKARLVSVGIGR